MTLDVPLLFPSLPPGAPGPREALAQASVELEPPSPTERELVARGLEDLALGLVYSHEHVRRLCVPDWRERPRAPYASPGALRIEWTRSGDMSHLGDAVFERRIHDALEAFASAGYGQLYALGEGDLYRLHAGDLRVTFQVHPRKLTVLATHRRERPSRTAPRQPY